MMLSYLHFACFLAYAGLALYLWRRSTRLSPQNRLASALLLALALWSLGNTGVVNPHADVSTVRAFGKVAAAGWVTFGPLFVLLVAAWRGRQRLIRAWWVHALLWAPALWFLAEQWFGGGLFGDYERYWFGWDGRWRSSPLTVAYYTHCSAAVAAGVALMYSRRRGPGPGSERRNARLLASAALAALVIGTLTDVVAPWCGWDAVPSMGNVAALIWAGALVFAMARYRFLAAVPALAAEDIVSTMSDLLFLLDQRQRVMIANRAAARTLQWTQGELEGRVFEELIVPEEGQNAAEILRDTSKFRGVRLGLRTKSGYVVPVSVTFATWRGPDSRPAGTICTARDMTLEDAAQETLAKSREELAREVELQTRELRQTNERLTAEIVERRRVEEELRRSEERFRLLFECAPDALYLSDLQGNFVDGNRKAEELVGATRDQFTGKSFLTLSLLDARQLPRAVGLLAANALGKPTGPDEFTLRRADGSSVEVEISTHPLEWAGRKLVLGVARDITVRKEAERERQRLEEERRQAQKLDALGQLAGGIAHDFNNMLGAIMGNADMLRARLAADAPQHVHYAQRIMDAAQRSAELTAKLLAFARKGQHTMAAVDVHQVIHDVIGLLRHTIDKRIAIAEELAATATTVLGERAMIENALLNLALNARDAMPKGGRITFATATVHLTAEQLASRPHAPSPGPFVRIDVRDTGAGMDEATRKRLFEPFFTTKGPDKGTGLGLASVYGTVQAHGGLVDVASEPGRGTVFSVYLPISAAPRQPDPDRRDGDGRGAAATVP